LASDGDYWTGDQFRFRVSDCPAMNTRATQKWQSTVLESEESERVRTKEKALPQDETTEFGESKGFSTARLPAIGQVENGVVGVAPGRRECL